jgi:hypothetical protein
MKARSKFAKLSRDAGSALLIAIFALLLISVVGLALAVSTGTDSALAGNYRTSTAAYYAAVAGLEEGRGRLLWSNPNFINKTNAYSSLFSGQGVPTFAVTDVVYIINPASGETVDPTNLSSAYADNEYAAEMGWSLSGANVHTPVNSASAMVGLPGPSYKWVRINPVTEKALGLDINGDGSLDTFTPLYYNGSGLRLSNSVGSEALEVTAFAYQNNTSKRIVQYVVAPYSAQYSLASLSLTQTLASGLTLAGNGVRYVGPDSSAWQINGNDPTTGRTCTTPALPPVYAVGITNPSDQGPIQAGIGSQSSSYTGATPPPPAPASPSVGVVTLPSNLQTPSQVESLIQTISQGADVVLTPTSGTSVPGSALPTGSSGMSASNPMTVVVNGDLDLTSWRHVGYGLLLVTGTLVYDPDASWEGIVLVMGKGVVTGSGMGIGGFDGTMLVAQSRNPVSGTVLPDPNLGASSVTFASNMGGYGIHFNSCMIQQAFSPTKYKILSFREISQ